MWFQAGPAIEFASHLWRRVSHRRRHPRRPTFFPNLMLARLRVLSCPDREYKPHLLAFVREHPPRWLPPDIPPIQGWSLFDSVTIRDDMARAASHTNVY